MLIGICESSLEQIPFWLQGQKRRPPGSREVFFVPKLPSFLTQFSFQASDGNSGACGLNTSPVPTPGALPPGPLGRFVYRSTRLGDGDGRLLAARHLTGTLRSRLGRHSRPLSSYLQLRVLLKVLELSQQRRPWHQNPSPNL